MTRDEATKQALSLGLSGQALQQKIEELMGNTASDFGGGSWKYGNEAEAEKKIADLEQEKRMNAPIEGAMGNIARGNQGDNAIANPNALDTSEVTQLHKEELADKQTPDNPNPATFTSNLTDEEAAIRQDGKDANPVTATPKTPEQATAKKRYDKSMMSIWDAYREGLISKETAGYFTIDALASLAKNMGRSAGNIGAQFSGGSIDNGHDESKWEQRQNRMLNTEITAETEGLDTFQNKFNRIALNKAATVNDLLNSVKGDAEKLSDDNPLKVTYLALAASIANGAIDGETTLAATGAKTVTELFDLFKDKLGK